MSEAFVGYFPFVRHMLVCLNKVAIGTDQFVPMGDRLLQLLGRLSGGCDKSARGGAANSVGVAVDCEVNLKITDTQKTSMVG